MQILLEKLIQEILVHFFRNISVKRNDLLPWQKYWLKTITIIIITIISVLIFLVNTGTTRHFRKFISMKSFKLRLIIRIILNKIFPISQIRWC